MYVTSLTSTFWAKIWKILDRALGSHIMCALEGTGAFLSAPVMGNSGGEGAGGSLRTRQRSHQVHWPRPWTQAVASNQSPQIASRHLSMENFRTAPSQQRPVRM